MLEAEGNEDHVVTPRRDTVLGDALAEGHRDSTSTSLA